MQKSNFAILDITERVIYLEDLNMGGRSMTNDAETVYAWCEHHYPGKKVVYKDSEGAWAQMLKETDSSWIRFKAWHGEVWDILATKEL